MTEYQEKIELMKEKLAAEEWGKEVKDIHAFNSDDCNVWYDKEPDEEGKRDGRVIDTSFKNGKIVRRISSTGKEYILRRGSSPNTVLDMFKQTRTYSKLRGWE